MSPLSDLLIRRKLKKKRTKKMSIKIKFKGDCAEMIKGFDLQVKSMKRTHFESEKRSRGRNRPRKIRCGGDVELYICIYLFYFSFSI